MKHSEIQSVFEDFAEAKNLKIGTPSHFEGDYPNRAYVLAKTNSYTLKYADARCGRRLAIVKNGKGGTINPLTSYLKPSELVAYMQGAMSKF